MFKSNVAVEKQAILKKSAPCFTVDHWSYFLFQSHDRPPHQDLQYMWLQDSSQTPTQIKLSSGHSSVLTLVSAWLFIDWCHNLCPTLCPKPRFSTRNSRILLDFTVKGGRVCPLWLSLVLSTCSIRCLHSGGLWFGVTTSLTCFGHSLAGCKCSSR